MPDRTNDALAPLESGFIQNNHDFFIHAIEISPEAVFWVAADGHFTYVNKAACESLGYSREELLSMHLWEVDPDYPKERWSDHWDNLKTAQSATIETTHRRKDGSIFSVEVIVKQVDLDGQTFHTAFVRDITNRKTYEAALLESKNRFRALLDAIPDSIWLKDADGVYLSCNTTFERFYGAKEADIIGKTDYDFVAKELADFFRFNDKLAMQAGKPTTNEEWVTFATTGERVLLLTTKVPMYDANGLIIGVLGVGRDITELKRAEEKRHELESHLQQTQKIESIGQLAGGIAHDFNNMLGVILGHSELALKKSLRSEPILSNLTEIQKAANHSADLTRQLLTFARKQTIAPQIIDLNEVVPTTLKMLQRLIGENIQLSWKPAPNLRQVKVDPSQVDQILANLCVNARDAIGDNGSISISTQNLTPGDHPKTFKEFKLPAGEYVQICVSDDGCGMDKETLKHIFEPFFTTKGIGAGTGLGLATVYGAVKQNGGFIDVRSEPGQGSTFCIFFPRCSENNEEEIKNTQELDYLGSETILLVEDEEMLLKLESTMLGQCGYQVLEAKTADKAISLAQSHIGQIHLLITDIIMPEVNGWEVSHKLRSIRPDMKVLFLSGYPADIISNKGVIEEGLNFLQKPVSMASLTKKIREILNEE